MNLTSDDVDKFLTHQLTKWHMVAENFAALRKVEIRNLDTQGNLRAQFNPARIRSSAANVDAASIAERRCFLCRANQPSEQLALDYGQDYLIEVNPYPIFNPHFTIPAREHAPQAIRGRLGDMLMMARSFERHTLFYNGPRCGASAPDHAHFQMIGRGFLPVEQQVETLTLYREHEGVTLYAYTENRRNGLILKSESIDHLKAYFLKLHDLLDGATRTIEPMLNLLCWYAAGQWTLCVFPRAAHRPACFYATDDTRMLISPAAVDMGGVMIMPKLNDYKRIDLTTAEQIFEEVCISNAQLDRLLDTLTR